MVDTRFMNWVDFDALRKETDMVLIPFGAVEVYGPHLPLGADGISTSALALRVASGGTGVCRAAHPGRLLESAGGFSGHAECPALVARGLHP